MNDETLKPCPFCGGQAELERQEGDIGDTWAVICVGNKECPCYCHRPYAVVSKSTAIRKWNTRVARPATCELSGE